MKKQVLFIQGGGDGGYKADAKLVDTLKKTLGVAYHLNYPQMQTNEAAPDFGWLKQIEEEIGKFEDGVIIVAHSLGASLLLKYLSEHTILKKIGGVFLLAAPFWQGNEDWKQGLKLREDFAGRLPKNTPIFFYHCRDDEETPFNHLAFYRSQLPEAIFIEIESGGHQFGNDLGLVAIDIERL